MQHSYRTSTHTLPGPLALILHVSVGPYCKLFSILFTPLNPTLWFFSVSLWLEGTRAPLVAVFCLFPAVEHIENIKSYVIIVQKPHRHISKCFFDAFKGGAAVLVWKRLVVCHLLFLVFLQCPLLDICRTCHSEVSVGEDVTDVSIIAGHVDHCEMRFKNWFKGEQTISSLWCLFTSCW